MVIERNLLVRDEKGIKVINTEYDKTLFVNEIEHITDMVTGYDEKRIMQTLYDLDSNSYSGITFYKLYKVLLDNPYLDFEMFNGYAKQFTFKGSVIVGINAYKDESRKEMISRLSKDEMPLLDKYLLLKEERLKREMNANAFVMKLIMNK